MPRRFFTRLSCCNVENISQKRVSTFFAVFKIPDIDYLYRMFIRKLFVGFSILENLQAIKFSNQYSFGIFLTKTKKLEFMPYLCPCYILKHYFQNIQSRLFSISSNDDGFTIVQNKTISIRGKAFIDRCRI